jgi:sorting nexin-8
VRLATVSGVHLAADEGFLERRRRGLQRFINAVVNHPVLRNDNLVNTFLTEKSDLSLWRKSTPVSLEEEHATRRLSPADEMSIPSELSILGKKVILQADNALTVG